MYRLLLPFLLFPLFLFSNDVPTESEILESTQTPLASLYGAPSTNVYGVNVINGDYHYSTVDFDLPGNDSLILQRTYCSSRFHCGGFGHGWSHNLCGAVRSYTSDCRKYFHIIASGSISGEIPFKTELAKKDDPLEINRAILKKGVTNCGRGEISGRTNIKNIRTTQTEREIKFKNGDGTENCYKQDLLVTGEHSRNNLKYTLKPNGQKINYITEGLRLHEVKTLSHNNELSNQIKFIFPKNESKVRGAEKPFVFQANSLEGKQAVYHFKFHKPNTKYSSQNILISKVDSNYLPSESYTYTDPEEGPEKLSTRFGNQHKVRIDYYKKSDEVLLYGKASEVARKSHLAKHRVSQISVALNGLEDLHPLCRFAYSKNKETKEAFTDVYNADNYLTRFHYSTGNYRLSSIERFKGVDNDRSIYRSERLYYGAKSTPLEGDLLFKTIENSEGVIHFAEKFDYDERGNVLKKDTLFRRFTGAKKHTISVKEDPTSNKNCRVRGGEAKSISYTYNALNLATSEDDGRLKTLFTYHTREGKDINLPKSIFVQKNHKILRRKFFEYDSNAGCTLKIEDDGCGSSVGDMAGVRCRKIARMSNREGSFSGLPVEIDLWASNGNEEHRISRASLGYNSHGYLEKETYFDANNEFVYEAHKARDLKGNILSETDALGQLTSRKFNEYGSVLEVQGPDLNFCTLYSYDWQQRPTTESVQYVDGVRHTTIRDYNLEGKLTKIQDPYGFSTEFIYNEQGRPIEIIYPPVRIETGEWVNPRVFKEYDFLGNLISDTDAKGAKTTYSRNDAGLPLQIIYSDGTSEEFHYSIYGDLLEKKERNNAKVILSYDAFSRLISEKTYDRNGTLLRETSKKYSGSLLISETDAEGFKTVYNHDYAGRVAEARKGKILIKYIYDSLSRVDEERRYFGENDQDYVATQFVYDLFNRVIEKGEVDATGKVHSKIRTTYDVSGHVTSTTTHTHAGRATSKNTYDPRGNLSSTTDPLGNTTYFVHHYDFVFEGKNVPCLEVIDPTGVKTVTISDVKGSELSTKVYSPTGWVISHVECYYDLNGKVVRKEHHLPNEIITTLYEYDSASRLIRQVNGAGTPEQISTIFIYNHCGELSEIQYPDGTTKHRSYDGIGRLDEEWSDDKSVHYKYTYNRQNQPILVENLNTHKKTARKYSSEGNLLSERLENGLKICYSYDRMNRLVECFYPDGSSVRQAYNPVFLRKAERVKNGQVTYRMHFREFDASGKPKEIILPQKAGTLQLRYDLLNRITALTYPDYQEKQITFDSRGVLVSKIVNNDLQVFKHDHLQQLTQEKTALYSHQYKNDSLNRQTAVDGHKQIHNAVLQLVQGSDEEYIYDLKGRRTQDSQTQFAYDKFDRLISVKQGNSTWIYTYDAFNRKMSRTSDGETVYYLYNGYEEIGSFNQKKQCIDLKVLSAGESSMVMAIELGERNYSPVFSSQRHIVGLVDMKTGKLSDLSLLTMFGKDLSEKPLSPWRFCGKRHESSEIGIIDFGFRFYHPKSAQWLTQDPLGESAGPNLYAYVKNNPACYIDRYGLMMCAAYLPEQDTELSYGQNNFNPNEGVTSPEIRYYDGFETDHKDFMIDELRIPDYYEPSCEYSLGLKEEVAGRGIGFVNGINNTYEDSWQNTYHVSGGESNVTCVYNATHGLINDVKEFIYNISYVATTPSRLLHKMWNNYFSKNDSEARLLMTCHSQGAVHVRNALIDYPAELRTRIDVLAIAPGAYIHPNTCGTVIHYRAECKRDGVPYIDWKGAERAKGTIITLPSHPDAPRWDHGFQSLTYQMHINRHVQNFKKTGRL